MKKLVFVCLFVLAIFNFFDSMLTIYGIEEGLIVEKNPLMLVSLEYGYTCFMLTKLLLVGFGSWFLWKSINHCWSRIGIIFVTLVYTIVICWHLWGLML